MTTTTLRPNASVSGTPTGAASVHAALSDDSDSSYVNAISEVRLGTVAMSGGVTKSLTPRLRLSNAGGFPGVTVAAAIRNGQTGASYNTGILASAGSTAYNSTPYTVSGFVQAVTLSQAEVDALTMFVYDGTLLTYGASTDARAYEVYADLVWVAKPVAAVDTVSPDPYTSSNIVPISWVNTLDSDGGSQTRYRLKVFTAAQYGAGGFDPETSDAFYDSEEVVSSSTSANTSPLDTATTYRAYVKVAQTVNGASHWSDWDFDQFDVDVDTADVDTVTAAGSNPDASITVTVERDVASEAWAFIEVQRSIDNGTTWSPVRGATYVDATGDTDTFEVIDYEVGNDVATLYRARATRLLSDLPITGPWVQSAASASWTSRRLWVKSPADPTLNASFTLQSTISPNYRIRRGVFDVIGSATPVVVSDVRSSANGTLALLVTTDDDSPLDLLSEPVVLLHAPQDWGIEPMYVSLGNVTQGRGRKVFGRYIVWVADFVEVDTPGDPAASAP